MNFTSYFVQHSLVVSLLILISLYFRLALQLMGQRWITTFAHSATIFTLPILTYVITNLISGNIALSLGMIGALSIVRFRNPVRSPLELSVYFGSITLGIAGFVDYKWTIFLTIGLTLSIGILISIDFFSKIFFKKTFFSVSFAEGNALSTIEINAKKEIDFLEKSEFLSIKKLSNNGDLYYVMTARNFEDIRFIQEKLGKNENIISYQLNK